MDGSHGSAEQVLHLFHSRVRQVTELPRHSSLTLGFCSRSERYPQVPAAERDCAERVPFHDVCLDGERRSLELIKQAESTWVTRSIGRLENEQDGRVSALPGFECLVAVHTGTVARWLSAFGIEIRA